MNINTRNTHRYHHKVIFIGDSGVGKTYFAQKIIGFTYNDDYSYPTIGGSFFAKQIVDNNNNIIDDFHIWDTAGQERYRSLLPMYYRNATTILLMYSITSYQSYNEIYSFLNHIADNIPILILIGNKNDLDHERSVMYKDGLKLKDHIKNKYTKSIVKFYEISAKKLSSEQLLKILTDSVIEIRDHQIFNKNKDIQTIRLSIDTQKDNIVEPKTTSSSIRTRYFCCY